MNSSDFGRLCEYMLLADGRDLRQLHFDRDAFGTFVFPVVFGDTHLVGYDCFVRIHPYLQAHLYELLTAFGETR